MHLTSQHRRVIGVVAFGALLALMGGAPTGAAPEGRDTPVLRPAVAWGDNGAGRLGDGSTVRRSLPVTVQTSLDRVATFAAGDGFALAAG
jgi:hypothetical protein